VKIEGIVETKIIGSTDCEVKFNGTDELIVMASGLILKLSAVSRETKEKIVQLLIREG
jgi:hypothetical protein